jgi:hypothetical protein
MHQRMLIGLRLWKLASALMALLLIALTLPVATSATTVPATPSAEVTDEEPPEDNSGSEVAPELPPPDLPSINAQGWTFELDSKLNTDLDAVPTQTAVYTVRREVTTLEAAQALVDALGIEAELVEQGENIWSANGNGSLFVSPDYIQFSSQEPIGEGDLPTDKDAIAFASEFLRLSGLLPPNLGDGSVANRSDEAKRIVVQYGPQEPGNVLSAYPGITVTLGPGGVVLEAVKRWAIVQRSDVYQLRSPNEAWQQVQSNQGYIEADIPEDEAPAGATITGTVTYNNVSIAYTTSGPAGGDQYLQPIFVFRGRVRLEDGDKTYAIRTYVPALANTGAPVG